MIPQPFYLFCDFRAHVLLECRITRHHGAAEHEILPHHDAQFVADVVEVVGLVIAAAPMADHVHVRIPRRLQDLAMLRWSNASREAVEGNHVRAFRENRNSIHDKSETSSPLIRLAAQFERAQSGTQLGTIFDNRFLALVDGERGIKLIERLRAVPVRIPEVRVGDTEGDRYVVRTRVETDALLGVERAPRTWAERVRNRETYLRLHPRYNVELSPELGLVLADL